jgi:hypothetical protein
VFPASVQREIANNEVQKVFKDKRKGQANPLVKKEGFLLNPSRPALETDIGDPSGGINPPWGATSFVPGRGRPSASRFIALIFYQFYSAGLSGLCFFASGSDRGRYPVPRGPSPPTPLPGTGAAEIKAQSIRRKFAGLDFAGRASGFLPRRRPTAIFLFGSGSVVDYSSGPVGLSGTGTPFDSLTSPGFVRPGIGVCCAPHRD